jgi:ATP-dependent DNA helicase DinG
MIRVSTDFDINEKRIKEVLSSDGLIRRKLPNFEERPEQIEMSCAVAQAFYKNRHLAVEAGTGVGKSFAYLVPAIRYAAANAAMQDSSSKLVKTLISTYTITLQEQLINKDIPLLSKCLPDKFSAVLAKGRNNYLCKRRLKFAMEMQRRLFDDSAGELERIYEWSKYTKDGSLSDLDFWPSSQTWDKVKSEHGNCPSRKCPNFPDCFYRSARRKIGQADIIVANHALLFSDLVLKEKGVSLLPEYKFVVMDEAHNIEHVAEEHFGLNISSGRFRFLLDRLYNPRTHKGFLAYTNARDAMDIVCDTGKEATRFFKNVKQWFKQTKEQTNGRCHRNFVEDNVSGYLNNLRKELAKLAKQTKNTDEQFEIVRFADLSAALVQDINNFLNQSCGDHIYWIETGNKRASQVSLRSAPINVGPEVKRYLFDNHDSVILTSATLSADGASDKSGFEFFAGRIGLDDFDAVKLGSPFDYEKQVTMYIEKQLPDPNHPAFIEKAADAIKKYIAKTQGRAFVLFTSYSMLDEASQKLEDWLKENDIKLLRQGSDMDRTSLLRIFKAKGRHVLFGTDSFWQGVDVPGEALSNVIIVRLPFAVPDQPLLAGRLEQIRNQGGNPFFDYQLPAAVIKFKQGFGRLIRTKKDKGIVVVLDSRILNKPYGKRFLKAIPKCKIEIA